MQFPAALRTLLFSSGKAVFYDLDRQVLRKVVVSQALPFSIVICLSASTGSGMSASAIVSASPKRNLYHRVDLNVGKALEV